MWWIGTRKGLFRVDATGALHAAGFAGIPVTIVHAHRGVLLVALEHGHFGAKLHRSVDGGATFTEVPAPRFDEGEAGSPSVATVWALATDAGGRWWLGTIPGGLFVSDDAGEHWSLVRSLWEGPERAAWFGGGADAPGIHSVCPHPSDPDDVIVGISCRGGVANP